MESERLCFRVYSLSREMVLGDVSMDSQAASEMVRLGWLYSVFCQNVSVVVKPSPARDVVLVVLKDCQRRLGKAGSLYSDGQR